jgi:amino acid transporter
MPVSKTSAALSLAGSSFYEQRSLWMITRLFELLVGSPLPTHEMAYKRLNKIRALAAFSPGALSSIAYANQEIFLVLVLAGSTGLSWSLSIGIGIVFLLVIVALSYYQTIFGYPSGGGSYVVARDNLGELVGLVAAASLMIDYVLTVAVSLTAGVEAFASAFPFLWEHRLAVNLFLLVIITLINLRGIQESGTAMVLPVYLFVFTYLGLIVFGLWRAWIDGPGLPQPIPVAVQSQALQPVSLLLILRAFASGCTALTGIEAISNGVPVFQPPEARNAGRTLLVMALLDGGAFFGQSGANSIFWSDFRPRRNYPLSPGAAYSGR